MVYNAVKVEKGSGGWGGPLIIKPKPGKDKILSVTGGGISPVANKMAELTGGTVIDAFKTSVPDEEVIVAVVDCGGTARCGVYPKKKILTINLTPVGQSGPLAKFITEELYVSGVTEKNIVLLDESEVEIKEKEIKEAEINEEKTEIKFESQKKTNIVEKIGKGIGSVVSIFYSAGRDSIDSIIKNILPFMAFVSMLIGIILKTGIGDAIAKVIAPYSGSIGGLIGISIIAAIPVLSPLLGPGAVIAQVVGVLIGVEIGKGNIPPQYALPALFAINPQVGADFIPVGLSLGEAEPETVEVGVPAILFSRLITGPLAVIIAYLFSFGLY
ncbi:PTS glucitol/sorbitol transporter subunit IIB [Anaerosalibacter massiliensis]|uniref:PTS glucitol/sorbitol transporter subunit IIB n=1 Tax=Anaerosalibacter massiliensis TaxID=1347392 RepID=A0A9X2S688_9FIRM|nr:PTS glucitol/sorbitol transporter subunit IIB [Anaerosalibacter massiliensis]MCR2045403.1 PTS glucitol/sorbitol transporter subunit IIB [Anaerosalibacter massiliensis]